MPSRAPTYTEWPSRRGGRSGSRNGSNASAISKLTTSLQAKVLFGQLTPHLSQILPALLNSLLRDHYLTAATYVSSRAFPSTILSATPSLQLTDTSHPILLPGIDSLNHARGTPVSWVISNHTNKPTALAVNLVLHNPTSAGEELFNNYGPKPNSELILGYGFALPANPSDTIVLQIGVGGGAAPAESKQKKLEVGRNASGAAAVWDEVLALVSSKSSEPTYEDELEAAGMLGDMLLALQDRLPDVENVKENDKIRPEVKEMLEYYVEGRILNIPQKCSYINRITRPARHLEGPA